ASRTESGTDVVNTTRSCSLIIALLLVRIRRNKTRGIQTFVYDPDGSHHGRFADGSLNRSVNNILPAVNSFHVSGDGRVCGHATQGICKHFPIIGPKSERHKKWSFASVVRVRGVEQVLDDLLPLYYGKMSVW